MPLATVKRESKNEVTEQSLYEQGVVAHGRIDGTPGDYEMLDSGMVLHSSYAQDLTKVDYRKQSKPRSFFVIGRVSLLKAVEGLGL